MTNDNIISSFQPKLLNIKNISILDVPLNQEGLLVYGEIHGIKENAEIIYTIVHKLDIPRIAIENSPTVRSFIEAASRQVYDFSLIDTDTFDSSILSLEVAKTLATLLREKQIKEILYIDTYFDTLDPDTVDHPDSPQKREQDIADNILSIADNMKTLCLLGQWHTQPQPVQLSDGSIHHSALHRIRQERPSVPFVHNIYKSGHAFNDGRTLALPERSDVHDYYCVKQVTSTDFDLQVPVAHRIQLES